MGNYSQKRESEALPPGTCRFLVEVSVFRVLSAIAGYSLAPNKIVL